MVNYTIKPNVSNTLNNPFEVLKNSRMSFIIDREYLIDDFNKDNNELIEKKLEIVASYIYLSQETRFLTYTDCKELLNFYSTALSSDNIREIDRINTIINFYTNKVYNQKGKAK